MCLTIECLIYECLTTESPKMQQSWSLYHCFIIFCWFVLSCLIVKFLLFEKLKKNVSINDFNFFFPFFSKSKALLKCIDNVDFCSWWRILFHLLKYDSILSVYLILFFLNIWIFILQIYLYSLVLSVNFLFVLLLWWWWNNSVVYIMEKAWRYFIYHDWHIINL